MSKRQLILRIFISQLTISTTQPTQEGTWGGTEGGSTASARSGRHTYCLNKHIFTQHTQEGTWGGTEGGSAASVRTLEVTLSHSLNHFFLTQTNQEGAWGGTEGGSAASVRALEEEAARDREEAAQKLIEAGEGDELPRLMGLGPEEAAALRAQLDARLQVCGVRL